MTVSIVKRNRSTGKVVTIPVTTSQTFRRLWIPAAELLGLTIVPLLSDPHWLEENERQLLLTELASLKQSAELRGAMDPIQYEDLIARVDTISEALHDSSCDDYEYIFG